MSLIIRVMKGGGKTDPSLRFFIPQYDVEYMFPNPQIEVFNNDSLIKRYTVNDGDQTISLEIGTMFFKFYNQENGTELNGYYLFAATDGDNNIIESDSTMASSTTMLVLPNGVEPEPYNNYLRIPCDLMIYVLNQYGQPTAIRFRLETK